MTANNSRPAPTGRDPFGGAVGIRQKQTWQRWSPRQVTSPFARNNAAPGSLQTAALFRGYNCINAARTNLVFALAIG